MKPTKSLTSIVLALLIAFASTVGVTAAQQAGDNPLPTAGKQIRVKVSLHVTGNYQHTGPKTIPKGAMHLLVKHSLDNSYTTEYVVAAEDTLTGLQKTNPLDPASQQEMNDYRAKVKAQADRVYHSADDLRGKGSGAPADLKAAMNPMAMMNNPEIMQKIMACGNDQACKQKIAMDMMARQQQAVSGSGGKMMGDVQAISNMCVNEKHQKMGTKGYEDCMNAEGEKRSTVKRSAADNEAEVPELPDRYFLYRNGIGNCQFKAHAQINESALRGSISDGEGGGDYGEGTSTAKGEADFDPKEFPPCANAQAAFDTKTNLFWGGMLHRIRFEPTRTGGILNGEAERDIDAWVRSALQGVPATGSKTQKFSGYQTATLTWSFVKE
jgi:hypothetical protein